MVGGYTGKVLRIDLSRGEARDEGTDEAILAEYIGGGGLAARILFDETSADTAPLSPDNKLIFMTGPMTGTPVPTGSRYSVVSLSPKTGIFGESNSSGFWGPELKQAGYDGLILQGSAPKPVYIWINDGNAVIADAGDLWGKDTAATDEAVRKETHSGARVACIGIAGENLVHTACIVNAGIHARVAGRTGMGAVMGSKNLKAIAVLGTGRVPILDRDSLVESVKQLIPQMRERLRRMTDYGTAGGVVNYENLGNLPIRNWRQGSWPQGAQKISGERIAETILAKKYHCKGCPIGCGREVKIDKGRFAGVQGAGPEYETVALLGSLCLIDDIEAIAKANQLCNMYGIDTMSAGSTIAFAMEAYEKGLLDRDALGGLELTWGNAEAMLAMVEKIAKKEGFAEFLGKGVKEAAEKLGPAAQEFSVHVKGLEVSAHDPRAFHSTAIAYATANRGGNHLEGQTHWAEMSLAMPELGWDEPFDRFATDGKGEMVAKMQDLMALFDALGVCKFALLGGMGPTILVDWLNKITGWDFSLQSFMEVGERIFNLKRMYNVRLGISRKDDALPVRLLSHRRGDGGAATELPHLGAMLADYYDYRGWSEDGIPTPEKTLQLGLSH